MSRSITIQPLSLVAGVALAAVLFLSMSQSTTSPVLRIEYGPQPRDVVAIRAGAPLVVPAGKVFVPTAVGSDQQVPFGWSVDFWMNVNGSTVLTTSGTPGTYPSTMQAAAVGLSFPAGSVVEAAANAAGPYTPQVWGYLAAAPSAPGTNPPGIRVAFTAPARDSIGIPRSGSLVVPNGKLFVVTTAGPDMSVTINGTPVYTAQGGPNPTAVPDGLVAGSGATVAVPGPSPVSAAQQVWGYFVSH